MDVARDVVDLFNEKDMESARKIAGRLDQLNAERQEEERRIMASIERRLEEEPALREAYCVVLDDEGWHRGVIGITASRVVERHGRPTLVISRDGDEAHGSGRSIPSFHLLHAIESCPELFSRYGGHAHAVGFALPAPISKSCASIWMATRAPAHSRRFRTATGVRSRAAAWRKSRQTFTRRFFCSNPLAWRIANQFSPLEECG